VIDLVIGLSMVTFLAGMVAVAANHQAKARSRLADHRAAAYVAESALLAIQSDGAVAPELPEGVTIQPLPDADAPPGLRWVQVSAEHGVGNASVVGLVRQEAQP